VSSFRHAARLIIFEIMIWIELKPSWCSALTAYCQSPPESCVRRGAGAMEGKRGDFTKSRNDSRVESLTMISSNVKYRAIPCSRMEPTGVERHRLQNPEGRG
jgi:hypothetical protein